MLPRFRVDLEEAIAVSGDDLKGTVASIFEKDGCANRGRRVGRRRAGSGRPAGRGQSRRFQHAPQLPGGLPAGRNQPPPQHQHCPRDCRHRQRRLGPGSGHHRNPQGHGHRHPEGERGWRGHGHHRQLPPPGHGLLSCHAGPGTRYDWRLHDQRSSAHGAHLRRRAPSGHQSHRSGRPRSQRASLRLRRRHQFRGPEQD